MDKYVRNYGKNTLEHNLDEDKDRGNFLTNKWIKFIYHVVNLASEYLFAFEVLFIGLTHQLKDVDIFKFLDSAETSQTVLLVTIVALVLLVLFITTQLAKQAEKPEERKWLSFAADIIRLVNYLLVAYFVINVYVKFSNNRNLVYTGYILVVMYILFFIRKTIFWLSFLIGPEKGQLGPWEEHDIAENMDKVYKDVRAKMDDVKTLLKEVQDYQ